MVRETKNATSSQPESLPGRAAAIKGARRTQSGPVPGELSLFNYGVDSRLIAIISYPKRKVFIQHVLTHKEYDRGTWKDD
jgi:mRNA-degrading endonuclease HigB of HigAB toxin-antitoxin module